LTIEGRIQDVVNLLHGRTSEQPLSPRLMDEDRIVGESGVICELKQYIRNVAHTDANVLITGETGTGKELVAEMIHRNSARRSKPFVCVNCAAIPDTLLESELFGYERGSFTGAHTCREGRFQAAGGGTIFLDEIGDMSPYAQAKILRVVESKEVQPIGARTGGRVDFRIIAATNRDLESPEATPAFRRDLYFRLNVARIHLPALRERKSDIPILIDHYIREFNRQFGRDFEGFTEEAMLKFLQYDWPGNVRELRNAMESSFVDFGLSGPGLAGLPRQVRDRLSGMAQMHPTERELLIAALTATDWNKSKAARRLQWSRMTLYRKMARYNVPEKASVARQQPPPKDRHTA
jgi:transcriptional regulator with PAS, ATPase and Fis domain